MQIFFCLSQKIFFKSCESKKEENDLCRVALVPRSQISISHQKLWCGATHTVTTKHIRDSWLLCGPHRQRSINTGLRKKQTSFASLLNNPVPMEYMSAIRCSQLAIFSCKLNISTSTRPRTASLRTLLRTSCAPSPVQRNADQNQDNVCNYPSNDVDGYNNQKWFGHSMRWIDCHGYPAAGINYSSWKRRKLRTGLNSFQKFTLRSWSALLAMRAPLRIWLFERNPYC